MPNLTELYFRRGPMRLCIRLTNAKSISAHIWSKAGGGFQAMYVGPHNIPDCYVRHPDAGDAWASLWIGRSAVDLRPRELEKVLAVLRPLGIVENRPAERVLSRVS